MAARTSSNPKPVSGRGTSAPDAPSARPGRLLAWFVAGAAASVILITALVALGLHAVLRRETLARAERDAERAALALSEAFQAWAPRQEGSPTPDPQKVGALMRGLDLVRVRVFTPDGRLLYSSDPSPQGANAPFLTELTRAAEGEPASVIAPAHVVWRTQPSPTYQRTLAATYAPMRGGAARAATARGALTVEACKDVTADEDAARATLFRAVSVVFGVMLLSFAALTAVMRRAQGTIIGGAQALGEARARTRAEEALRAIVEGTAPAVGQEFFRSLVEGLAQAFSVRYAFVGEVGDPPGSPPSRIRLIALWAGGAPAEAFEYAIAGSPCETALRSGARFYPSRVLELFPDNPRLAAMGVESYMGVPLADSHGRVIGLLGVLHDAPITPEPFHESILRIFAARAGAELERIRADQALARSREQLRVAERLASIGALAAGIGHDLNNLLLPMRGQVRSLLAPAGPAAHLPDDARSQVRALAQSIEFLRQLGENLRMLADGGDGAGAESPATDIPAWWTQIGGMLSRAVPRHVSLRVDFPDSLPSVAVAPARLTQAVLNLLVNAGDAIDARTGGEVTLGAAADPGAGFVRIDVADTGRGMAPDVATHAFDPFFTTKPRGASTGLGLALVQHVASSSGGSASIRSEVGRGTTISLRLPVASPGARGQEPRPRIAVGLSDGRIGAYAAAMLAAEGFHVTRTGPDDPGESDAWIVDPAESSSIAAARYLRERPGRRVFVLGRPDAAWSALGARGLGESFDRDSLRAALYDTDNRSPVPGVRP